MNKINLISLAVILGVTVFLFFLVVFNKLQQSVQNIKEDRALIFRLLKTREELLLILQHLMQEKEVNVEISPFVEINEAYNQAHQAKQEKKQREFMQYQNEISSYIAQIPPIVEAAPQVNQEPDIISLKEGILMLQADFNTIVQTYNANLKFYHTRQNVVWDAMLIRLFKNQLKLGYPYWHTAISKNHPTDNS